MKKGGINTTLFLGSNFEILSGGTIPTGVLIRHLRYILNLFENKNIEMIRCNNSSKFMRYYIKNIISENNEINLIKLDDIKSFNLINFN